MRKTKEHKKVSVIVPVYNAEKYIDECIQSVLNQSYSNVELILINDGSKDQSGTICEAYASKCENVIYKYQENSGVSAARNAGLDLAAGEYVAFVDSDDKIKKEMISLLVEAIESADADLSICGFEVLRSNGVELREIDNAVVSGQNEIAEYFAMHFLEGVASSVWAKLYKRELVSHRFDTSITMGEDLLFNLECIKKLEKVLAISPALYTYNKQNVFSLVNNYKVLYYEQELVVCSKWIEWLNSFGTVDDANVQYRILQSFLRDLYSICLSTPKKERTQALSRMITPELKTAISKSIHKYKFPQRNIFKAARINDEKRLLCYASICSVCGQIKKAIKRVIKR